MTDPARWPARRSAGGDAALWVAAALLFLGLAALVLGGSREPGLIMLVLCTLAALLGLTGGLLLILAVGYRGLAYELTESALRVDWLGRTLVVPYPAIHGIYTGQRLEGNAMPSTLRWPGISVGSSRVRGFGRLRFFATSTDQSALTLVTVDRGGVILSARDPGAFRTALIEHVERHQEMVGEESVTWHQTPARTAPWTALLDVWLPASAIVSTLFALLVLTAIVVRFDALPDRLPLHFDASGQPNLIAPKFDLLRLPFLGLVVLMLNVALGIAVHPREPLLGRLLWVSAAAVQLVLLVGVLRLLA